MGRVSPGLAMRSLQQVGLGVRLYLGFGVLAMGLTALAWTSHRGLAVTERALIEFHDAAARRDRIQELRNEVGELQRSVQVYSYVGHVSMADSAKTRLKNLKTEIDALSTTAADEDERDLLGRLQAHVDSYQRGLSFAAEERTVRDRLVRERVPKLADLKRSLLAAQNMNEGTPEHRTFVLLQLNLRQYLVDPTFALLAEGSRAVNLLGQTHADSAAAGALKDYERTFTRTVQATRGYLFLISVVLAGEAMEFSHAADELAKLSAERVRRIASNARSVSERARTINLGFSTVLVLLGLGLAVTIGRSISAPLLAITETLRRLGQGERGMAIPGVNRHDEIGVMARAANVFREQNERTAELLEETRTLARSLDDHKRDLQRSNDELEQFVHTVSHDLKAPLVTSLGFLGMMRELADQGHPEAALTKLVKLERAHGRMEQLLNDLLDLSRVGRTDQERSMLDVSQLLHELVEDFARRWPEVAFELNELPPLHANESRVLQIFENLIGNAVKYAGASARVQVGGSTDGSTVRYYVKDDGPGIAPEFQEEVFGLFQRLDPKIEGTGVGLAVVRRVMAFHGGRVWVESKGAGDGATFWLEFPEQRAVEDAA